uniref:Piwi domain-containing protein n=1 Tax=Panagrolaimus sp. ES5 TaxID=591445 RepID=A0AC34G677_9BILA
SPAADPSFVGLSSNHLEDPQKFGKTWFHQKSKQEVIDKDLLTDYVEQLLEQQIRNVKIVAYLRDGVSEGQYSSVIDNETESIKEAGKRLNIEIKIVAFIVTKNTNTRHFVNRRITDSVPAGSLINFGVRHGYCQWFMVPHQSYVGTKKSIMITKLYDEINMGLTEAQKFIYDLCFMNQITNHSTSLPAPLIQADKIAHRAQSIYNFLKRNTRNEIPASSNELDDKILKEMLELINGDKL